MIVIYFQNTERGSEVVEIKEVDPDYVPQTAAERFFTLFEDVPLLGGKEWQTCTVDELVGVFRETAVTLQELYQQRHDEAVAQHEGLSYPERSVEDLGGWAPPRVPGIDEIIASMAAMCRNLADWAEARATHPFFAQSDMSYLIETPRAVAARLTM